MISVQEFARRLTDLGPETVTSHDVEDLADAAGVRIDPGRGIDAGQAQQMLDRVSPSVPVSAAAMVASPWPPSEAVRPAVAPVGFSNPGAVEAPSDPPTRPRRSGQTQSERRRPRRPR
ncbi:hypothetical protein Q0Z83_112220 [Actinoplanes sichuanensis]|uniref:Uncharacterized protein n=1 Tax=Actinoplanes sichuanensis TaxID=512349 RepID=A0ABW4A2M7_9ACTN|nr:hypothetical protein [Actinoplanes sichuanensis]BEL13031.1 hypothetical protein Q0Z83_112220 [Actinoplanes sichuanensis]